MVLYKLKDITGNPTTTTRKSPFHLMFESTGFDSDLYHYMFSPNASFSGELIFYDRDEFKTLYKVEFHKAYIVGLTEEFDNQDNLPLHINLAITCGAVKIKDVKKIENWVFEDPFIEVEPTVLEEVEKKVINCFITDVNGDELEKYKTGNTIILNIETENRIGDVITLSLQDKTHDFKYNGERLYNDTIKNYVITSDLDKIELEVIKQG